MANIPLWFKNLDAKETRCQKIGGLGNDRGFGARWKRLAGGTDFQMMYRKILGVGAEEELE